MRSRLTGFVGALATLLVSGCVMSPLPEPPQATVDLSRVFTADPNHRGEGLNGCPGAASPAGALVRIFHLDGEELPVDALVEEDGSFSAELDVDVGHELRLQVITEETRSAPLDVVTGAPGAQLTPVTRPLAGCLLLEPAAELDLVEVGIVSVENRCAEDVELQAPRLRRPLEGLELGADRVWPAIVPPASSVAVEVLSQPGWDSEEVFFIEATAPEHDRRPITLVPHP